MNPHTQESRERNIHRLFEVGLTLKGLNAILEVALGSLLLFTNVVNDIVLALAQNELIEDPNDFFATHVQAFLFSTPQAQFFGGLYLLSHGVVKGVLVAALLRNKLWAYPASLAVFALFIAYQVIKWLQTHSLALVFLTIFDLVIVWLIWHEYRHISAKRSGTIV